MFGFIKELFTGLLTSIVVNASRYTKCVYLSDQKFNIQPILINLHPNKYSQELHYYPLAVKLDKCVGRCNSLNDLSNKLCGLSETEDLNLSVLNMIREINESKTLTKHISCKRKCNCDGGNCNSNQKWNNEKCQCDCKNKKKKTCV